MFFGDFHFIERCLLRCRAQMGMCCAMRTYTHTRIEPLLNMGSIHQGTFFNVLSLTPYVASPYMFADNVTRGRKPIFFQDEESIGKIIKIPIIKSNAYHFAFFLSS